MKFEVDTDTVLQLAINKMTDNIAANAKAQGLSDEEVAATLVLNKKKVANDAQNITAFFVGLYVEAPKEETTAETVVPE